MNDVTTPTPTAPEQPTPSTPSPEELFRDQTPMTAGQGRRLARITMDADETLRALCQEQTAMTEALETMGAQAEALREAVTAVPETLPPALVAHFTATEKALGATLALVKDTHARLAKVEAHLMSRP